MSSKSFQHAKRTRSSRGKKGIARGGSETIDHASAKNCIFACEAVGRQLGKFLRCPRGISLKCKARRAVYGGLSSFRIVFFVCSFRNLAKSQASNQKDDSATQQ